MTNFEHMTSHLMLYSAKHFQIQTLDSPQPDQLIFTQPRDPNNNTKPAYKKIMIQLSSNKPLHFSLFHKNNEMMMMMNAKLMPYQNCLKKHLYNIFVLLRLIEQNDMIHDMEVEVHHVVNNKTQNRYRSTARDCFSYDKSTTLPQYFRSRYYNYKRDSRSYRFPYRSSYKSSNRRDSRHRCRSRSFSGDNDLRRFTSSFRPPSRPRDSRVSRSRLRSKTRNTLKTIQPQTSNDPMNFEAHIYQTTEMANAVTPASWVHSL